MYALLRFCAWRFHQMTRVILVAPVILSLSQSLHILYRRIRRFCPQTPVFPCFTTLAHIQKHPSNQLLMWVFIMKKSDFIGLTSGQFSVRTLLCISLCETTCLTLNYISSNSFGTLHTCKKCFNHVLVLFLSSWKTVLKTIRHNIILCIKFLRFSLSKLF